MAAVSNAFTDLVGCRLPLQQAGMGGVATPELALAVTGAGALGMLGTPGGADALTATLDDVTGRADGPVGINFLMPFCDPAAVEVAAARLRLVEFFWGGPDPAMVARVHDGGALCAWQVGSADEASAAYDAGCDLVVAQGVEAGGHVRGTVGLLPLLDAVL
ncbi:MAG TPA: nitronate monooxygenase, partial [Acidimicrobiales bacterium]|nr:nitronate monooxygenase [Acidimicrobiales bacterium]